MRSRGPVVAGVVALTLGLAGTAQAQSVLRLTEPEAVFPESFSFVSAVRALPDGRLLIADPLENALKLVDMAAGTVSIVGRVGQGPDEYRQPDAVWALPGDSTLLVDLGNGRLVTLGPDMDFGPTTPIAQGEPQPGVMGGGLSIVIPRGVDRQGRVYFQPFGGMRPGGGVPDSTAVARWDRGTGVIDTVTMAR